MSFRNCLACAGIALLIASLSAFPQEGRGKAELNTPSGPMTVNYGRPSLQGRDMLSMLTVGDHWRLGKDDVTVMVTPVNLTFGAVKIPKGTHGLWLKRLAAEKFELVFNSQTTGHGMTHEAAKDTAKVALTKTTLTAPVETLTIDLKPAAGGGSLVVRWGTSQLSASFQFAK